MKELEMFVRYMSSRGMSENTIKAFPSYIRQFLDLLEVETIDDLKELKLSNFQAYLEALQEDGNSVSTRNCKLSAVKAFFRYLEENDFIDKNIAERVKHSKMQQRVSVQPTREEAKKILDSVKSRPKLFALYTLLMNSGLRIEECLTLRLQDFRDGCVYVIGGKGGKDRIVPLNETASSCLANYIVNHRKVWTKEMLAERHGGDKKLVKKALESSNLIFLGKNGLRMYNSNLNVSLDRTAKDCGIDAEKVHPHAFRHYFANEFVKQGGRVNELQSILGHASLKTTQIYFENDITSIQKTVSAMSF